MAILRMIRVRKKAEYRRLDISISCHMSENRLKRRCLLRSIRPCSPASSPPSTSTDVVRSCVCRHADISWKITSYRATALENSPVKCRSEVPITSSCMACEDSSEARLVILLSDRARRA
ncbi:hypothetical protein RB213_011469 [Colletotrichum asianum]